MVFLYIVIWFYLVHVKLIKFNNFSLFIAFGKSTEISTNIKKSVSGIPRLNKSLNYRYITYLN